ncbi:hypothetical protein [Catenuloplanes indicus]|uniref:Uncharacterized protein n=1 Tax=Catenuloplanes indicus TaxID=137267 RepID=A0AAE4B0Z5_9ACTN|nr:hypothetical protein [Catenuloplanes indicus]MDQ0370082.1 hypothetical protein [Catenuloplanes indicus]
MEWNVATVRPGLLAGRITAAALLVGGIGGATAVLLIPVYAAPVTPAGGVLAVGVPVLLVALIVWRIAAETGRALTAPPTHWIAWGIPAAVLLIMLAQMAPWLADADWQGVTEMPAVLFTGALIGWVAAAAALVVVVPLVLLLRAFRARIGLLATQLTMTVFAAAATAAGTLAVTADIDGDAAAGVLAAITATVAAFAARRILTGENF